VEQGLGDILNLKTLMNVHCRGDLLVIQINASILLARIVAIALKDCSAHLFSSIGVWISMNACTTIMAALTSASTLTSPTSALVLLE
jgi:hypothetical protein